MAENLEDLFCQIIHSERKAEERKNYLNEVKLEIIKCQDEIKEIGEDIMSRKGEMVMKVEQLNEEELKINWLTNQEKIFTDQQEILLNEGECLEKELKELDSSIEQEVSDFCRSVKQFSHDYDLSGNGRNRRESFIKEKLLKMRAKESALIQEVTEFSEHMATVNQLTMEHLNLREELERYKNKEREIQQQFNIECLKSEELDQKRKTVASIPQTDEEFKRLQKELTNLKSDDVQKKCVLLQQELQNLKQQLWQKNVQKERMVNRCESDSKKQLGQATVVYSNKLTLCNFDKENVHQNTTDSDWDWRNISSMKVAHTQSMEKELSKFQICGKHRCRIRTSCFTNLEYSGKQSEDDMDDIFSDDLDLA